VCNENGEKWLLVGKEEEKRPLGRLTCRRMDNNKIYLLRIEWGVVDWISLAHDTKNLRALANVVMNYQIP
jgi:hypothetical protein